MEDCNRCSWLFVISSVIVFLGFSVLGASLGTLGVTSSYVEVFPFGAPLWTGTMVGIWLASKSVKTAIYTASFFTFIVPDPWLLHVCHISAISIPVASFQ